MFVHYWSVIRNSLWRVQKFRLKGILFSHVVYTCHLRFAVLVRPSQGFVNMFILVYINILNICLVHRWSWEKNWNNPKKYTHTCFIYFLITYCNKEQIKVHRGIYLPPGKPPNPKPHLHLLSTQCQSLLQLSAADEQSLTVLQEAVAGKHTHTHERVARDMRTS